MFSIVRTTQRRVWSELPYGCNSISHVLDSRESILLAKEHEKLTSVSIQSRLAGKICVVPSWWRVSAVDSMRRITLWRVR